ncbi:T9SS type A sorting domain-containing protein [bacterium]|nr:T9SS type A sorting domain-containing protein [bacterium]
MTTFTPSSIWKRKALAFLPMMLLTALLIGLPTASQAQVSSFPYTESFESGSGVWSTGGGTYSMWTRDSGGTSSSNTGPTTGHNGNYYYYTETSSSGNGAYDYLTANFNFSSLSLPVFSFWYHMYGQYMGTLEVQVNGGSGWTTVWSRTGNQQASQTSPYMQAVICLTGYANNSSVSIRFKGTDDQSFTSDMAVDYIQVYQGSNLSYTSSTSEQPNLGPASPGATNLEMLRLKVTMSGDCASPTPYQFTFNTNGTTNVGDIVNAKLFYTGNDPNFSASNQVGSTVSAPPAAPSTFSFSGNISASGGDNYFWLVYDASASAPTGNYIDAECVNFQINSTTYTPSVTAPAGSRMFMAPLSGNYTINPSGSGNTNFPSFGDAIAALDLLGVQGPVHFSVAAATYNEQLILSPIAGASSVNTITFDGGTGNAASRIITASVGQYRAVVEMDGVDYVQFRNLTVNSTNSSNGYGFRFTSSADHNEISDCVINLPSNTTSSYHIGICATSTSSYSSYGDWGDYNLIKDNTINSGYYGIRWNGYNSSSTTYSRNNKFIGNTVQDFYYYGMYLYYSTEIVVTDNYVKQRDSGTHTTSSGYGIYVYYPCNGPIVANNYAEAHYNPMRVYRINNSTTSTANRGKVYNNMLVGIGTSTLYGLYVSYAEYADIAYNSVNLKNTTGTCYALYEYGQSSTSYDVHIVNNFISYTGNGTVYMIYNYYYESQAQFDYNAFWHDGSGTEYWRWDGTTYSSFNAMNSAWPNHHNNSVVGEPYYYSDTDLHSYSHVGYQAGTPFPGITTDYDGEARDPLTPCIGADEYPAPPPEYDIAVQKVILNYASNKWARIEGMASHPVTMLVENVGLKDNPTTIDVGYGTMPMNNIGDADFSESFNPNWMGSLGVVEFSQELTGLAPSPSFTLYGHAFWGNDQVSINDEGMTTQEVFIEKVHGFEDFNDFDVPYFSYMNGVLDLDWTIIDNNGGDMPMTAAGVGVGGSAAIYMNGGSNEADEWIITPAAELNPAASYRIGFVFDNMQNVPVSIEVAYGSAPNPGSMTTFATFSNVGNGTFTAKDLWLAAGEAGDPYFNTPANGGGMTYIGIHVVTAASGYEWSMDNIKLDDNPSPPPKIGYALPGSPIEDFVNDDSDPIVVTATYKQPGKINKTFQVATTTNIYGENGDMLWDVETADKWISITKESPDPTLMGYNFTPPRPRQFQTFTLTVDPSGLAPGVHMGSITFYAILFNEDFPPPNKGLVATNQPLVVPVELRIVDGSGQGSGKSSFTATLPGPFTVAGSPYKFVDNQTNDPVGTLSVTAGQIDALTIHCYPNQLPQNLARMLYVKRYWVFEAAGSGWMADFTFPYADHEASMIFDRNQLRGVRQEQTMGAWEMPIAGTTSSSDPLHNEVTVMGLDENNIIGNIALAHPYFMFERSGDGTVPQSFGLLQNYPNPFNPSTSIAYNVPEASHVRIAVYNSLGMEVAVLVDETVAAGRYEASFDASKLSSGTYIYRMTAGDFTQTRSMTLSK